MVQAERKRSSILTGRQATVALDRVAALSRAVPSFFERLEGRVMFDGDTVVTDLTPSSDSNAAYVLDLAAGDTTAAPPVTPAPAQPTPAPTGGAVVVNNGSSDSDAPTTGTPAPATAPTTAPVARRDALSNAEAVRSPSDFRYVLRPGTGWTGATTQPAAVGDPAAVGYDAKAIARWDVVPYQTFDGLFNVGVVAFHREGIDRVEFSVNGGDWTRVRQMTTNPETGVVEYTATLNAKDFADGALEVRAVAYPTVGEPRVLESLPLNANANGTLPSVVRYVSPTGNDANDGLTAATPKASVVDAAMSIAGAQGSVDGATIYLTAGQHTIVAGGWWATPSSTTRWMTITRAPGLSQSDVTIMGTVPNNAGNNDGIQTNLVKVTGVTIRGLVTGSAKLSADSVWYDNVAMIGPGRSAGASFREGQFNNQYITNSTLSDMQDAVDNVKLYRNVQVQRIAQSGFHNALLVINSTVEDIDRGTNTNLHPDAYQFTYSVENAIAYGVVATQSIGAFGIRMQPAATSVAVVDCQFTVTAPYVWELERPYTNIYVANSAFSPGFSQYPTFTAYNLVFDGCTFSSAPAAHTGMTIR